MDEPKGGEPNFLVISLGDEPKIFGEVGGEAPLPPGAGRDERR